MSADVSASIELEDDSLSAGLDQIAAKFAAIAASELQKLCLVEVALTLTPRVHKACMSLASGWKSIQRSRLIIPRVRMGVNLSMDLVFQAPVRP